MAFDFDTAPEGTGFHASQWENIPVYFGIPAEGAIAMHVADMDFRAAPCVLDALRAEVDRGYMGYFGNARPVQEAIAGWMARRHGYGFDPDHTRFTHGVVAGFASVLDAFSEPGEAILLFSPVYHAFYGKAQAMNREVTEAPLAIVNGRFEIDTDALEAAMTGRERIMVICSPHNPGGRVWTAEELRSLAAFAEKHDLLILSDEIHMDLTFPGVRHVPTAVAAPEYRHRLITITAASKGFNLAGGETGFIIVEDDALRARLDPVLKNRGGTPNRFGMIMTKAAFTDGDEWSAGVRAYIAGNFALWRARMNALPGISVMDMDATYLSWVDLRDTGCGPEELDDRIIRGARVAPSKGGVFGTGGEGWMRFNLAMPRARLETAIARLEEAFSDLQ